MMIRCLIVLAACFAMLGVAPTTDPASGTVIGVVVDASGKPAAGAIVTLGQAGERMRSSFNAETNDKGEFKVENVPEGEYNLNVRSRDLKSKGVKTLTVVAGKTCDVGTIKLSAAKRSSR